MKRKTLHLIMSISLLFIFNSIYSFGQWNDISKPKTKKSFRFFKYKEVINKDTSNYYREYTALDTKYNYIYGQALTSNEHETLAFTVFYKDFMSPFNDTTVTKSIYLAYVSKKCLELVKLLVKDKDAAVALSQSLKDLKIDENTFNSYCYSNSDDFGDYGFYCYHIFGGMAVINISLQLAR